jgi:hypothetical protein
MSMTLIGWGLLVIAMIIVIPLFVCILIFGFRRVGDAIYEFFEDWGL